jgi:hypothetical protein
MAEYMATLRVVQMAVDLPLLSLEIVDAHMPSFRDTKNEYSDVLLRGIECSHNRWTVNQQGKADLEEFQVNLLACSCPLEQRRTSGGKQSQAAQPDRKTVPVPRAVSGTLASQNRDVWDGRDVISTV